MSNLITEVALFSLLPAAFMLIGGAIAAVYTPGPRLTSATQHFAAGVVFAAVAKELLPSIGAVHSGALSLTIGFTIGVLLMVGIKWFTEKLEETSERESTSSLGLLSAVGIDVFIDGLLIGVAFLAGEQGGVLIAIALAIEILFLGLSTTATLGNRGASVAKRFGISIGFSLIIPIGALLGAGLFSHLPQTITSGVLAFGVAALLYLVTEELLTEAHEVRETPWITACFFLGFLIILLLE